MPVTLKTGSLSALLFLLMSNVRMLPLADTQKQDRVRCCQVQGMLGELARSHLLAPAYVKIDKVRRRLLLPHGPRLAEVISDGEQLRHQAAPGGRGSSTRSSTQKSQVLQPYSNKAQGSIFRNSPLLIHMARHRLQNHIYDMTICVLANLPSQMYMGHVTQSINDTYKDEQPYRLNKIVSLSSLLKVIHIAHPTLHEALSSIL